MRRITESTKKIIEVEIIDHSHYTVGQSGVTRILSYDENGEMAAVPWLAILRGNNVWVRIPARLCIVEYAPDGEEEIGRKDGKSDL